MKFTRPKILYLLSFIAAALLVAGVFSANATEQEKAALDNDGRIHIVTTTAHIADLVQNIVGDKARVEALIGAGIDPHLYRPLRSDIMKLSSADIIFYNGRHLEGKW